MSRFSLIFLAVVTACGGSSKDSADTASGTTPAGTSACVDGVGTLSGTYTEDLTLTADCTWLLSGGVLIGDDTNPTTLTIEAGTTLAGESATNGFLVITRSSRIVAEGTADAPIVFTSDQPEGSRARGNWGGLVINGRAPINACADGNPECEAEGEGGTGKYGGSNAGDDSGVLKYVRIEYGGTEISPDNEINGLTLAGVGSGTTIDYVQVHANLDDGIEFFGGTVNVKHAVVTCTGDDLFDWDLGWSGKLQYGVAAQCSDAGNNGIEADSNEADFDASPRSNPTLSNLTFVGQPGIAEENFGILVRRGTGGQVSNALVTGFSLGCLAIRDTPTYDNFRIDHSLFDCAEAFEGDDPDDAQQEEDIFAAGGGNFQGAAGLPSSSIGTDLNFVPAAGSDADGAGLAPSDAFFDSVDYIGAFEPGGADWTDGWTQFAER